jgi:hypothetical protein
VAVRESWYLAIRNEDRGRGRGSGSLLVARGSWDRGVQNMQHERIARNEEKEQNELSSRAFTRCAKLEWLFFSISSTYGYCGTILYGWGYG